MKTILAFLLLPVSLMSQNLTDISLPQPRTTGGRPLMEVLTERHSSREFANIPIDLQNLSDLLWAADGYNRPSEKKRTAPNSRDYQEIDIYVVTENGVFLWNAGSNVLKAVVSKDIRTATGKQDFVGQAPLCLVYVADFTRVPGGKTPAQVNSSYANTAFIAENVYLFCASEGLNTIIRDYFDEVLLSKEMLLKDTQQIILCQTVGKPPKN